MGSMEANGREPKS